MKAIREQDGYADGEYAPEAFPEHPEPLDGTFTWQELARLDEALTMSSRETGLRFTL